MKLLASIALVTAALVACKSAPEPAPRGEPAAATTGSAPPDTPAASTDPSPTSPPGPAAASTKYAATTGAGCAAGQRLVTGTPFKIVGGTVLTFTRSRGGGCPTRAVYTAYVGAGDPAAVLVCEDPGADPCEMMLIDEPVSIDLSSALAAAGASSAIVK